MQNCQTHQESTSHAVKGLAIKIGFERFFKNAEGGCLLKAPQPLKLRTFYG